MQNTKLIHLFKALKTGELREFASFLDSPFYVKKAKKEKIVRLFEYLKKNKDDLNSKKLDKEYVFKKVFKKGETFKDWKIRELRSLLSKLIEEYFIQKEASENDIDRQMLLIKSLEKRQVDTYFFRYARSLEDNIERLELKNMEHYFAQLQLQHLIYYHPSTSQFTKGSPERLLALVHNTDMFYSLTKLRYNCELSVWERLHGERIEGFISSEVIENLGEEIVTNNLLLYVYWLFNSVYKYREIKTYNEVKQLVINNIEVFDKGIAHDILIVLINSVGLVVSNEKITEVLSLYKIGIKYQLFIKGNRFMAVHFTNIVSLGSSNSEYEWTQNFINQYYMYLPGEEDKKENIAILYRAYLSFAKGKYADVGKVLYKLEFEDVSYGLRHYTLLIRSLYELKEDDVQERCTAFKLYLYRKSMANIISLDIRVGYNNFIKIVMQLVNTWGVFKPNITKIKNKFDAMDNVAMKAWLNEKIEELVKKRRCHKE